MHRRSFLSLAAGIAAAPAFGQDAHPVVNLDQHGDMPAGMDMASENVIQAKAVASPGQAQPVLTRSGGILRHGTYLRETILTPTSIVKNPPRKLFTVSLPGDRNGMESQPLIVPNVTIADGTVHDLLICSTMGNQVYAHDANNGTPLWMVRLGTPITGSTKIDGHAINQFWGVLSTGVVSGNTLYVVSWTSADGSNEKAIHRFHGVSLKDGSQPKPPIALTTIGPIQRKQRASLLMLGRKVYVPFGTVQETNAGAHGYITSIDVDAWTVAGEWNATPTGAGGGIWMAGQGPSSDGTYLYFMTGNGDYDGVKNFGESFVKLDQNLRVVDHWSPFRDSDRTPNPGYRDMDLGSGGCVLIPELGLVCGAGKDGILYVLNRDNLKAGPIAPPIFFTFNGLGLDASPKNIRQLDQLFNGKTHHMHSTPIYWNGKLWCMGENGNLRVGSIGKNGVWNFLGRSAEVASPYAPASPGGMTGGMLALSANGNKDGILFAIIEDGDANREITTGRIFAFDAQKLGPTMADGDSQILRVWMSDPHHKFNKFCPLAVSNGKIYCPTYEDTVEVWSL
jgi:hypothetical protein